VEGLGFLFIDNATCTPGDNCNFTVRQTGGTVAAAVTYQTVNGTAMASGVGGCPVMPHAIQDYADAAGLVTVPPNGIVSIAIWACSDDGTETISETFNVNLTSTSSGTIMHGSGIGTIIPSGPPPPPPPPSGGALTAVAPNAGGSGGGQKITITGVDLVPGTCTTAEMTQVTSVVIDAGATAASATNVVVVNDTTITGVTSSHGAGGPFAVVVNQGVPASGCTANARTLTSPLAVFSYIVEFGYDLTVTVSAATSNPSGCGQVVGPGPGFVLSPAPAPGSALAGIGVLVVNIDDASTARLGLTDSAGIASFPGITAGAYRITTADSSSDYTTVNISGIGGADAPAGYMIDTRVVNVTGSLNLTVNLVCKRASIVVPEGEPVDVPTPLPPTGTKSVIFGCLMDWLTGLPISGATILVNVNDGTDANPQLGLQLQSVLTDPSGRFETLEIPAGPVLVRVAPGDPVNCHVSGTNTCSDAMQLLPGRMHDASFVGASGGSIAPLSGLASRVA
jgi:hypothetical protein